MKKILFMLFAMLSLSGLTLAEEWNPYSTGPVITWIAPVTPAKALVPHVFGYYSSIRGIYGNDSALTLNSSDTEFTTMTQQLFLQYGLVQNWEVAMMAFYNEASAKIGSETASSNGFSDTLLFVRYQVKEAKGNLPCITYVGVLKAPTGKYQEFDFAKLGTDIMGAGAWVPGLGVVITEKIKPFIFHMDMILSTPVEAKIYDQKVEYGVIGNLDLAVEGFLPAGFNWMLELNGMIQAPKKVQGEVIENSHSQSWLFTPAIGWSNDKIQTLVGYQRSFAGVNTLAIDSYFATVMLLL
jgi:hypothetical protein